MIVIKWDFNSSPNDLAKSVYATPGRYKMGDAMQTLDKEFQT